MARLLAVLVLFLGLTFVAPHAPAAEPDRAAAQAHYQRGREAFQAGDYDQAILELTSAIGFDRQPVFFHNIARAHEMKGDLANALRYLEEYLSFELADDERRETVARIAHLRDRLAAEEAEAVARGERATVTVTANVVGAGILVDGALVGHTPSRPLVLPRGEHRIRVVAPDHEPFEEGLELQGGEARTLAVRLVPLAERGWLALRVTDEGAEVRVDGRVVGTGPVSDRVSVEVGSHEVVVAKAGYLPYTASIEVAADGVVDVRVTLEPIPERIVTSASDAPAWVMLLSGVAVAAGGGVLLYLAGEERGRLSGATRDPYGADGNVIGMTQVAAEMSEDTANTYATASYALLGVGGAAAITGIVLFFALPDEVVETSGSTEISWGSAAVGWGPALNVSFR